MVATASYAATSAASTKHGKMTAFEKQATELALSVNNSISGMADQVLGNLRYSPNGQVNYVQFVDGNSRQTGILANELADRIYNELKAVPREYRERVAELIGLEKVNAVMDDAFGNSYVPQDMSLATYVKAAWNMGGNPLERARNVLDAVGIYFNQESTAVADSVRFNPTLQKISPYVIFGASYSNLTIEDNRLYGLAIGLALAYGMQKAGEIKNEAARKTMDVLMKGMLLLGNAPVGLMYIAAGNERAKGSEAFSEGNTASGVNNLRNARDLELIAGMYSVGNAVTAPTTELTMEVVGNRVKPIVYVGAATVGAGTLAWILANWHKPQAKAAAGVLACYIATVACGALADGGSGSPPVTPAPAQLAPTAGASTTTETLTQPSVNSVPTHGTGDAQTMQPGTDVYINPQTGVAETITEPPVVAVQTSIASLFKIFIDNTLDKIANPSSYATQAVTPVDGVATVTYPEGGVHPLYVCVNATHADLLQDLVISSFANPAKVMYPASTVYLSGLDLECKVFTDNPYNLTGDGHLAVGTPTAESTLVPSFDIVLSFVNKPSGGGGGNNTDGDGSTNNNNGGGGGTCPDGSQPDPVVGCNGN